MADPTALFTVAEARSYAYRDDFPLGDSSIYPDDAITIAEAAIRDLFTSACGVAFIPTTVTEILDGNASNVLRVSGHNPVLESPRRPLTVSAASIDGAALTAPELAAIRAHHDGRLVRTDGGSWSSASGYQDLAVSVTYVHGWADVPALVKEAALRMAAVALVGSDVPESAVSMSDNGTSFQFARPGAAPHGTSGDYVDARIA